SQWTTLPPLPTAHTSLGRIAWTLSRSWVTGVGIGVHAAPSQCSASPALPTAHTSLCESAETPFSVTPLILVAATALPFQWAMAPLPTAQTSFEASALTALNTTVVSAPWLRGAHWDPS